MKINLASCAKLALSAALGFVLVTSNTYAQTSEYFPGKITNRLTGDELLLKCIEKKVENGTETCVRVQYFVRIQNRGVNGVAQPTELVASRVIAVQEFELKLAEKRGDTTRNGRKDLIQSNEILPVTTDEMALSLFMKKGRYFFTREGLQAYSDHFGIRKGGTDANDYRVFKRGKEERIGSFLLRSGADVGMMSLVLSSLTLCTSVSFAIDTVLWPGRAVGKAFFNHKIRGRDRRLTKRLNRYQAAILNGGSEIEVDRAVWSDLVKNLKKI